MRNKSWFYGMDSVRKNVSNSKYSEIDLGIRIFWCFQIWKLEQKKNESRCAMNSEKPGFKEVFDQILEKAREEIKSILTAAEAGTLPDVAVK
jgi:hypothetical protein